MYFDDFSLHDAWDVAPVVVEKEKMIAFAREYDPIAIHTDEEYAKGTHFGALIAPGVMTFMSVWASFLSQNLFGDELIAGKSTKIEWHKPVYAGDTLYARSEVTALTVRNARNGIVEVTVTICNQHGVCVLSNVTEMVIKRREQKD
ncbi:MAG: MaoC family dehydratase N-terminal domain-containing protein [Clostridia bacterium]|nr:MaoC family dehydratase N-terminal domain-containing protein [Clostridia bacterium]